MTENPDVDELAAKLKAKIDEHIVAGRELDCAKEESSDASRRETACRNRLDRLAKECQALYEQLGLKPR